MSRRQSSGSVEAARPSFPLPFFSRFQIIRAMCPCPRLTASSTASTATAAALVGVRAEWARRTLTATAVVHACKDDGLALLKAFADFGVHSVAAARLYRARLDLALAVPVFHHVYSRPFDPHLDR